jgi:hypothetical protein
LDEVDEQVRLVVDAGQLLFGEFMRKITSTAAAPGVSSVGLDSCWLIGVALLTLRWCLLATAASAAGISLAALRVISARRTVGRLRAQAWATAARVEG